MLVPLSQRALFCMFFLEIRMLTRSLKTCVTMFFPWLSYNVP